MYSEMYQKVLKFLFSERGEGEEEGQAGQGAEGSAEGGVATQEQEGQGASEGESGQDGSSGQGQEGQAGEGQPTLAEIQAQFEEMKQNYEILKGQSGATERNLATERKALESMGMKAVRDSAGNVQIVPIDQDKSKNSRFTDEHKNQFFKFFPDQEAGKSFLKIMDLWGQDFFENNISRYDQNVTQRQQFEMTRGQSVERMYELFPSLKQGSEGFNKAFYDKADQILMERYWNHQTNTPLVPNADLIAAHEASIEMGVQPSTMLKIQKDAASKANSSKKIVSTAQGNQSGQGGGWRKLSFAEYQKLSPEDRAKYDEEEINNRGK